MKVPFIPYNPDIKRIASNFLLKHNKTKTIPVQIEKIAEFDFDINIIPIPNLQKVFDIVGFTASNLKEITVDEYVYENRENRYRFTIAHEIGHIVMHAKILKTSKIKETMDYKNFMKSIPVIENDKLEYQANTFAGLVLVPDYSLSNDVKRTFLSIRKKWPELMKDSKVMWEAIAMRLSERYRVSQGVIERRMNNDNIKDKYIDYFKK